MNIAARYFGLGGWGGGGAIDGRKKSYIVPPSPCSYKDFG